MAENIKYLEKLDRSRKELEQSKTISFSMEEVKEMEKDDWKPTKKIIDFMREYPKVCVNLQTDVR